MHHVPSVKSISYFDLSSSFPRFTKKKTKIRRFVADDRTIFTQSCYRLIVSYRRIRLKGIKKFDFKESFRFSGFPSIVLVLFFFSRYRETLIFFVFTVATHRASKMFSTFFEPSEHRSEGKSSVFFLLFPILPLDLNGFAQSSVRNLIVKLLA